MPSLLCIQIEKEKDFPAFQQEKCIVSLEVLGCMGQM